MESKDQQIKHVVEGLALGVLANGVTAVITGPNFEWNFNHAWRHWSRAAKFPSLGRGPIEPGNLVWGGVYKSECRRWHIAYWTTGKWFEPVLRVDWDLDECLDSHADERATARDWIELGRLFVERFKPDEIVTSD